MRDVLEFCIQCRCSKWPPSASKHCRSRRTAARVYTFFLGATLYICNLSLLTCQKCKLTKQLFIRNFPGSGGGPGSVRCGICGEQSESDIGLNPSTSIFPHQHPSTGPSHSHIHASCTDVI